ncbi:MAG: hypothetical protein ACI9DC_005201 [Gammaproteobacteria bacterium]|jgi:hypothetical protein
MKLLADIVGDYDAAAGSLSSQAYSLPENVRWSAEFLPAQGAIWAKPASTRRLTVV